MRSAARDIALPLASGQAEAVPPYRLPVANALAQMGVEPTQGLTTTEAVARLQRFGPNELPSAPPTPAWKRFVAQFEGPLTLLLLFATVVSFIAWLIERDSPVPYEALTILAIVILNAILGYIQENRAEQSVATLRAMSAPTARVLRDGRQQVVPAAQVVPGDILLIEEGDTLAADGRVIESIAMRVAESALTGESTAVSKDSAPISADAGIGDQINMVFSGTAVAAGRGKAVVTTTGSLTEIGRIAGSLQVEENETTPLQRELDHVGRLLGRIVIAIAILMAITIVVVDRITTLADLVDVLLLSVSLAVAAVPEGLTAITTIVLSLGMQRMANRHVIVRKLSAVETLGSTTVIASDKTGTLTKNEMTVRKVVTASGVVNMTGVGYEPTGEATVDGRLLTDSPLRDEVTRTLAVASLVNNANLLNTDGQWTIQGDPTEGALVVAAFKLGVTEEVLDQRFPRVGEVPFTSERKMMSTAHTDEQGDAEIVVATKGAPDVLLTASTAEWAEGKVRSLTPERRAAILGDVEGMAHEALRTLGVAYRTLRRDAVTGELSEDVEQELIYLGTIGMIDPPRPEARDSVAVARHAGVRPMMITGDHPSTATAIAAELGISQPGERAVTGAELQKLDDDALQALVKKASVYARVSPEHKLRIVRALKADGEVAAMTGDGVNDAPALKTADIGVAMGITGTDVSKGAADMILTDDNFASIVAAVEEGRSIFANIQKFLRYLLTSNIGEVMVMFFGVILARLLNFEPEAGSSLVVPLLATQILWINLVTDSGPALALGVDPPDPDQMSKPPRDPRTRVIDRWMWFDIAFVGTIMAMGTLAVMDWALPGGLIPGSGTMAYAQTMAFTTLVFFQLFNVFNARSDETSAFHGLFANKWIWIAVGVSILLQVAVIYVPFLQTAFSTVPLTGADWLIATVVASSVVWLRELVKLFTRSRRRAAG